MVVSVGIDALMKHAAALNSLGRSAFPVAVRQTLNSAAYDMKQTTMPQAAKGTFTERQPNFFRANSKVIGAQGFDANKMQATMGFTDDKIKKGGSKQSIDDLEQQEHGGQIGGRSFIPMDTARTGGSNRKMVRANARLAQLKFVDASKSEGKTNKSKFVNAALFAGVGGYVLGEYKDRHIVWRINAIHIIKERGFWKPEFKLSPVYSFEKGRKSPVKSTHFNEKAAMLTQPKITDYYNQHAEAAFAKALKP